MRLSWNEIRARAAKFSDDWKEAVYERGETHSFYNDFFEVFGVQRRKVASFEAPIRLLGEKRGFIDLFWKGVLLVEQKSAGRDLKKAKTQALDYFPGLKDAELPRYILLSDFQTFELHDLEEGGGPVAFALPDLHKHIERFTFILGVQKREFKDQDPVNVEAAALMGKLHDALKASGYDGHDLERFLVRLVFCLFADDTGIFDQRGMFLDLITGRTSEDGSDTGQWLHNLFDVLNTPDKPVNKRQKALDEDLAAFPYVNGDLFRERLPTPSFDKAMRALLIEACEFNWDAISPAIFGSLFQSVMNAKERRASGAHYTTEKNILKVIGPLFLDDLKAELEKAKTRRGAGRAQALQAFQAKLAGLTFFDPACGCGNFLIIAYRELRNLEIEVLKTLYADVFNRPGFTHADRVFNVASLSKIDVSQFYGIEIGEFPARIAEVALWMMDHIMNNRLSLEFGEAYARIPIKASPHIHHADALEKDWATVLAPEKCSYVLGNPPFIGQSFQTPEQRLQMARVIDAKSGRAGSLDYVCAWFLKAGAYVKGGQARICFVSTNSITQGEQVAQLWPLLFDRYGLEIAFAHRTFAWGSDARGVAHVHVVIVGLAKRADEPAIKRLFSYDKGNGEPVESQHGALSPYLVDCSNIPNKHLTILDRRMPLADVPLMRMGSKIVDNGHYLFDDSQKAAFLANEPNAATYFRPVIGSVEFINGISRWILALRDVPPQLLRSMPSVMERISAVKAYRLASRKENTRNLADMPTEFEVTTIPDKPFLAIPKVSSERREYLPIGWISPPTIPSQLVQVIVDAEIYHFGILNSAMHMAWLRHIGGRLKSDYQYSIGIVYNTFPWPEADEKAKAKIRTLAQAVLDARLAHPGSTLADLYDPDVMPPDLRKAHKALDAAVDRLYRAAPFTSDRERVEHLFGLYEKLSAPVLAAAAPKAKRGRKGAPA
ncbi:MAG: SAM-dependent methyltransferase [Rhizobiales bacterium PAR1]|nr:MAG: SAM-dependent methyltransferase [Rhizobiales bacterium PAR1]